MLISIAFSSLMEPGLFSTSLIAVPFLVNITNFFSVSIYHMFACQILQALSPNVTFYMERLSLDSALYNTSVFLLISVHVPHDFVTIFKNSVSLRLNRLLSWRCFPDSHSVFLLFTLLMFVCLCISVAKVGWLYLGTSDLCSLLFATSFWLKFPLLIFSFFQFSCILHYWLRFSLSLLFHFSIIYICVSYVLHRSMASATVFPSCPNMYISISQNTKLYSHQLL